MTLSTLRLPSSKRLTWWRYKLQVPYIQLLLTQLLHLVTWRRTVQRVLRLYRGHIRFLPVHQCHSNTHNQHRHLCLSPLLAPCLCHHPQTCKPWWTRPLKRRSNPKMHLNSRRWSDENKGPILNLHSCFVVIRGTIIMNGRRSHSNNSFKSKRTKHRVPMLPIPTAMCHPMCVIVHSLHWSWSIDSISFYFPVKMAPIRWSQWRKDLNQRLNPFHWIFDTVSYSLWFTDCRIQWDFSSIEREQS